jgi:membrane fusion protein, epimerase transport system
MSEQGVVHPVQTSDAVFSRIGYFAVVVILGGFSLWATLAPIDGASVAPGVVVVESSRKTIQHLEGGIISEMLVREGAVVSSGQPLVVLDATQIRASVGLLKTQYVDLIARLSRLESLRQGRGEIRWQEPLVMLSDEEARMLQQARADQHAIFLGQSQELANQIRVLEEQKIQVRQRMSGLEASIPERQLMVRSYEDEGSSLRELVATGFSTEQRVQELERLLAGARANLSNEESELQSLRSRMLEVDSQILSLRSQFGTRVEEQVAEVRSRYQDVLERLKVAEDQLARSVIRAPDAGVILKIAVKTVGGVVSSGQPIMELVPTGDQLRVEARVSIQDIDRVGIGQEAEILFSAFNAHTTPRIFGSVMRLSADRLVDEATGMPYFLAEIDVPKIERDKLGDRVLLPGMPADVLIKTGARSLWRYLMKPIEDAMSRALRED